MPYETHLPTTGAIERRLASCLSFAARAGLLLITAAGCRGPSVDMLVREGRGVEAFTCDAKSEGDVAATVPVILDAVAPAWRLQQIQPADLPTIGPETLDFDKYVLAFVTTTVRESASLKVSEIHFVGNTPAATLFGPETLARVTGEPVPGRHDVVETDPLRSFGWRLLTLGLLDLSPVHVVHDAAPTDAEIRAAAPRAAKLHDAIVKRFGRVDLVALQRGPGDFRTYVAMSLIVRAQITARRCDSRDIHIELRSPEVTLGANTAWPAGEGTHPFGKYSWTEAVVPNYGMGEPIHVWNRTAPPH
jgi:hypothetical protein